MKKDIKPTSTLCKTKMTNYHRYIMTLLEGGEKNKMMGFTIDT